VVCFKVIVAANPVTTLARRMIATVIVFGMSVLVLGALVPFGVPGPTASLTYTAFATYAAIVASALLRAGEPNGLPAHGDPDDAGSSEEIHGAPVEVDELVGGAAPIDESDADALARRASRYRDRPPPPI
jgi:hypothetical protein